ncbi:MAG: carboxymuconolactone decarboxylase family protein [Burkholderiales bacterium]
MNSSTGLISKCFALLGALLTPGMTCGQMIKEVVPPKVTALPADIDPQSRSRLPLVKREALDEQGKRAFDAVTDPKSRLRAELVGPAGIWLNIPELSPHIREVNWYLRNRITLEPRLTELAILVAVRESNGQNEWTAHETAGRKVGLDASIIDIVKYRRPIENVPEKEALIMRMGREILRGRKLTSHTYAQLIKTFGQRGVIELVMLMANYTMTSVILQAFDQQLRPDLTPLLPVPEATASSP